MFGYWKTCRCKGLTNGAIGVEVNLPVMLVVTIGSNSQYRSKRCELQDLNIGRRAGTHVRDRMEPLLEYLGRAKHVDRMIQLCFKIHSAIRIYRKVLNVFGEYPAVSDESANVV